MRINYFEKGYIDKKISKSIISDIKSIIASGKFSSGKYVEKLEESFSTYYNTKYAVAVNSGTSALHLSLLCLNIEKDNKIVTTSSSFIATTAAIIYANLKPKFIDINKNDFLFDYNILNNKLINNNKYYLPVSLYGKPVNILKMRKKIGSKKTIVVDCSQSHGARIDNDLSITLGDLTTFSFYPTKILGSYGEGGIILTNNKKYYEKIIKLRNWGNDSNSIWSTHAFNYRMDEFQAAVISNKLKYLDKEIKIKNKIAKIYNNFFHKKGIKTQTIENNVLSSYYIYPILVKNRNLIIKKLLDYEIETRIHYQYPIHKSSAYKKYEFSNIKLLNSEKLSKEQISIPIHTNLSEDKIDYILRIFKKIF